MALAIMLDAGSSEHGFFQGAVLGARGLGFEYLGYREGSCPEAERASREVLSLPVYPELTQGQLDEVVSAVRAFYGR